METIDRPASQAAQPPKSKLIKAWRSHLLRKQDGEARACEHNVALTLTDHPDFIGRVRFNELTHAAECRDLPWDQGSGWRPWEDRDDTMLALWCQLEGIMVRPAACAAAVQAAAGYDKHHPVIDYLARLVWDGVPAPRLVALDLPGGQGRAGAGGVPASGGPQDFDPGRGPACAGAR